MPLKLMYITNSPSVVLIAQKYGVDRIWIDLEIIGKLERQRNRNSVKSYHSVFDISAIVPLLTTSEMIVRINSWNEKSPEEIQAVIKAGTDIIMLPYWKTPQEVERFLRAVNGRCRTSLLLETKEGCECLDEVLSIPGIDEVHIGLNDLHISYGLNFMFELLTNGVVERLCEKIAAKGISYGFGGIAGIGGGAVPAEKIILEYYRLGCSNAILSRSFCDYQKEGSLEEVESTFREKMKVLREFEQYASAASEEVFRQNQLSLKQAVDALVSAGVNNREEGG